jgi:hypothetical protein
MSISARKFKLDRARVAGRIEEARIKPKSNRSNKRLYLLEDVEFILPRSITPIPRAKLRLF